MVPSWLSIQAGADDINPEYANTFINKTFTPNEHPYLRGMDITLVGHRQIEEVNKLMDTRFCDSSPDGWFRDKCYPIFETDPAGNYSTDCEIKPRKRVNKHKQTLLSFTIQRRRNSRLCPKFLRALRFSSPYAWEGQEFRSRRLYIVPCSTEDLYTVLFFGSKTPGHAYEPSPKGTLYHIRFAIVWRAAWDNRH